QRCLRIVQSVHCFPPVSPCPNAKAVPIRNRLNSLSTRSSQYVISRTHSRNREVFARRGRGDTLHRTARLCELFRLRADKQEQYEKTCKTKHDPSNQHVDFKHVKHDSSPITV